MFEITFSISLLLILYIYIGYPVCIWVLSRVLNKKVRQGEYEPHISIIISAYNEEDVISRTIENKLSLNYPQDKVEVIVVSDGSTDKTDKIIKKFIDRGVDFIRQTPRQGKTAAVNKAVERAHGEIIIFSDANSIYDSEAVTYLLRNLYDANVGYVTGKMVYMDPHGSLIGDGCNAYMRYENYIRLNESGINSVIGVDGGIDAMRKELYEPMSPDQLPDFVQPLRVMEKGYRVVYESEAILEELSLTEQSAEYGMRVRVSLRALWALFDMRSLMDPLNYPVISWQLLSHKVLRYFAWLPLIILFVINIIILQMSIFYTFMFISQLLFYGLAFAGFMSREHHDVPFYLYGPYYFVLINIAAADACLRFLKGEKQILWNPRSG